MRMKYVGKRKKAIQDIAHKRYVFSKENNYIAEVPDPIVQRILMDSRLFLPTTEEIPKDCESAKKEAEEREFEAKRKASEIKKQQEADLAKAEEAVKVAKAKDVAKTKADKKVAKAEEDEEKAKLEEAKKQGIRRKPTARSRGILNVTTSEELKPKKSSTSMS